MRPPLRQPLVTDTLGSWVARTVALFPDNVAVDLPDEILTYAELWERAGWLAGHLQRAATNPIRRVALYAALSAWTYVGYLAALRLGATVVPLNPLFPPARIGSILRAAQPDAVLVDRPFPVPSDALVVAPDDVTSKDELDPVEAGDVAYILYTSGSTGRPKGVPIRHGNVLSYLEYIVRRCQVTAESRLSHTFDLTFDVSIFDLFAAWGAGTALVVPRPREHLLPVDYVTKRRITHWSSVPSIISLARRMRVLRPGAMPNLSWSVFLGEQLSLEQAEAWADAAPNSVLENAYGPTELTVTVASYQLPRDRSRWPRTVNDSVPIGPVYPHLKHLVLDEHGAPAEVGELCVQGPQRFAGYLDPADDARRFRDGYYRTGDRVQRVPEGLVHLGRLDQQMKIRGYRVELGEIETTVRGHPAVYDAVVLVAGSDERRLLHAIYTADTTLEDAELDRICRDKLPPYMIPDVYTHRLELPLSDNGKIDRAALQRDLPG